MKKLQQMKWNSCLAIPVVMVLAIACKKLPEKKDYLSQDASFNMKSVYEPILGRTALELTQFSADGSTYPLIFSIENARTKNGGHTNVPELFQKVKVQEWKRDYTGLETSLAEIEAKRVWVEAPFLEVRSGSGDIIFRNAPSTLIRSYPDSGYLFDIKVRNKGNERVIKDFWLRPIKEVPYEPYEFDVYTRERKTESRPRPSGGGANIVPYTIHPTGVSKMYFTKDSLFTDTLISVYFTKENATGHSLTFKFVDPRFNPIDPAKFSNTQWDKILHGFNRRQTTMGVTYDVAYPIPLTQLNTTWANSGKANVKFGYSRKGFGGERLDASFGLNFAIYEPGDWTITFYFRRDPIFNDD
ncbi:DUF5007 domain-containing protein [Chitinophaga caseinilytica]|uniref:DUF5007 domain-containing protein n=1 Tax=Chitinophaga caseinilytica TaxID=2267521 RepID=UPI003C2EEE89